MLFRNSKKIHKERRPDGRADGQTDKVIHIYPETSFAGGICMLIVLIFTDCVDCLFEFFLKNVFPCSL